MLMKLIPCVNFTNILIAVFTQEDPKSVIIQSSCQYLIGLLGSLPVEAVHKMLMKLPPAHYEIISQNIQILIRQQKLKS